MTAGTNSFWQSLVDLVAGTIARASDVNSRMDGIAEGFDAIETELNKCIQITTVGGRTTDISENAATRANKLLGFDADGDVALSTTIGTYRGNYSAASVSYNVRDVVKDAAGAVGLNNIYICNTAHTSAGLAADIANWDILIDAAAAVAAQTAAETAETNAETAATNASASAALSEDWATTAEDVLVDGLEYSAKHYAAKAAASASAVGYVISGGAGSPTTAGSTYHSTLTGASLTGQVVSSTSTRSVCPVSGTVRDFYVKAGANSLNGSTVFTVRKNGSDQALTVTVTAGSVAVFSDTVNTFAVAAGDQLEIKADGTASSSGSMTDATWGVVITP